MEKIAYFGTRGCRGHFSLGINYILSSSQEKRLNTLDSDWFKSLIRKYRNDEHKCSYWIDKDVTLYCLMYSVDDDRHGSHTDLIVEGHHTIEEMESIINGNEFLKKQFDVKRRFPDESGKTA